MTAASLPYLAGRTYKRLQVEASSPAERVLLVYDAAILACRQGEPTRLSEALGLLAGALDPRRGEVAFPLSQLYEYVEDLGQQERFEEAARILQELRATWAQALSQGGRPAPSVGGEA